MATRCVTTSSVSAFSLWILAQRAIWFRFEPIRARQRGALSLQFGVRDGPGPHPANRSAHQIRER